MTSLFRSSSLKVLAIAGTLSTSCSYQYRQSYAQSKVQLERYTTQEEINNELPSLTDAQNMKVYRAPQVLTKTEIYSILKFEEKNRDRMGQRRRDGNGVRALTGAWFTSYLNTDGLFEENFKDILNKLMDIALNADKKYWNLVKNGRENVRLRVVELHSVSEKGGLLNKEHFDQGSLITIDVMLSNSDEFKGGELMTLESNGELLPHTHKQGDVLVFPSHKYHCVKPVLEGTRKVLIIEVWSGETRHCAHRCLTHLGPCEYTRLYNKLENFLLAAFPEIDPW